MRITKILISPLLFTESSKGSLVELSGSPKHDCEPLSIGRLVLRGDNGQSSDAAPPTGKRKIV